MNYCLVENNAIVEGPRGLPRSWRNVSGLNLMDASSLQSLGWLPVRLEEGAVDEKFVGSTFTIVPTEVIETKQWRKYTDEEVAENNAQKASQVRSERNKKLADTDWTQGKDIPDATSTAWSVYRQALRDVPSQPGFPWSVNWPSTPSS
jgi:hypothetical protein